MAEWRPRVRYLKTAAIRSQSHQNPCKWYQAGLGRWRSKHRESMVIFGQNTWSTWRDSVGCKSPPDSCLPFKGSRVSGEFDLLPRQTGQRPFLFYGSKACVVPFALPHAFQDELKAYGMVCSMRRKRNCWDNAPVESWFSSLKSERVHGIFYATHSDMKGSGF